MTAALEGGPAPVTDAGRPLRVLNVITRMIVGGAQETAMLECALLDPARFSSEILSGPQTGPEGSLFEECRERGVRYRIEPTLVRELSPLKDVVALWRLWRLLRRERWDIVHLHSSKAGILGRCAAWLAGVPVIVHTAHGWAFSVEQPKPLYALYVGLEWLCARLCHVLVVVAEPDRAAALRLGIGRPEQYELVRSGIEVEFYRDVPLTHEQARARLGLAADAFVVGSVGRLSPQKAPLDMLVAFSHLARERSDAVLVMVGDGPLRAEVEAAGRAAGLSDRIHLLGIRRDVPELLRAFDVLALTSRWEGLPRVFPQAMAAGLPIVATRVDGAPDAVLEAENGFLVEVGDMEALGERLMRLARDRGLARRMGEAGRARVDSFSATRMVRRIEEIYLRRAQEAGQRRGHRRAQP